MTVAAKGTEWYNGVVENAKKSARPEDGQIRQGGTAMAKRLEDYVTTIPDFPEPGIMFRDITTILSDADGLKLATDCSWRWISWKKR